MNLEKNKVYRLVSSSEQTIVQTINGNQQTVDSKTLYAISIKMIDSTPAFMVTEVHIDSMKTSTNTMGKVSVMSSATEGDIKSTDAAGVVSCIMNRLSKSAIYVKIDYSGKPIEVMNGKMLSSMILKDTSSISLTGPTKVALKKQVSDMISDQTLLTMVEMFTGYLPGREVASGGSWEKTVKSNSGGMTLDIVTTYHLDGINGNSANVTAESSIKTAADAKPIESGVAKVTYDDLIGMSKSSMIIEISTGLLTEEKAKTHISGNLGISGPGFSMQMPMDITGESKTYSVK
jgi:hypothetical protein